VSIRHLLIALGAALAAALPGTVAGQSTARYVVNLAGANVASIDLRLEDDGSTYDLALTADITGLGQLVGSGTGNIQSRGDVLGAGLASRDFSLLTRSGGEDFRVAVEFAGGDVTAFRVEPPITDNAGRVPIERKDLRGVNDMLAAFVVRAPGLDQSVCRRDMQVFTGVERFDLSMTFTGADIATSPRTGYQGPVVLCSLRYTPVSGHFTTSEMTSFLTGNDRILIWYAPLGTTGYFIPYRVLISTSIGDLSMVLTAMKS